MPRMGGYDGVRMLVNVIAALILLCRMLIVTMRREARNVSAVWNLGAPTNGSKLAEEVKLGAC